MLIGKIITFIPTIVKTIPKEVAYNRTLSSMQIYRLFKAVNILNFIGYTAFGIGLLFFINDYIIPHYKTINPSSSFTTK